MRRILCSALLLFWTTLSHGQNAASRPPLLQQLDGSWTMSGDVRGKPVTYALEAKSSLLGAFTELRMQDVQVPPKYAANVYIGYDAATKKVIVHWMDSFGAKYSIPHGTGTLEENTVQFTFPYEGGNFRDTFTFDPETGHWTFLLESEQSDGSWKQFAKYKVVRKTSSQPAASAHFP
jgi:hypothetical protein